MSEKVDDLQFGDLAIFDADDLQFPKLSSDEDSSSLDCLEHTMANKMEAEVLNSIKLIGYQGPLLVENEFKQALEEGPKSVEYTKLVSFLTKELRVLCNLDECVNGITAPEDAISFIMEASSFLNELGCPYSSLTQGHVSDRLNTVQDRLLLVEHLVTELMAARILRENRPEKKIELKLKESSQAADLRKILQILGFPKPPSNITMQTLMQKMIPTVQKTVEKAHADLIGTPIFNGTLSEKQWATLGNIQQELHDDYLIRREMLLKRLDCTIQSFQWSGKTKGKDEAFEKTYSEKRKLLKAEPDVDLSDLLASRDDLAIIEKTSSASVRKNTKSSINKVIIGLVPDRGGRTSELAPPPPEMPPWQQRSTGPGRGGFQGQSNRGGSNYSRGGGQQNSYRGGGQQNSYSQGGGNYSQGRGSYNQGGGSYTQGGGNYAQGASRGDHSNYSSDSRSGGGGNRAFDSAGSYGGNSNKSDYSQGGSSYSQGKSNYSRGGSAGSNYSRGGSGGSDYSRGGTGGSDYSRGGNNYSRDNDSRSGSYSESSTGGYSQGGSRGYSQSSGGYSQGTTAYSRGGFDSAGSYGSSSQDYQEPKRAKTYDQFQQNKTTYADQYVQESQHNQQYHSRDNRDNRSRGNRGGRSNYNRGGGSYR